MKIAFIAPTYLPSRRANTIQVMKMAQAMAVLGHEVKVWVPGEPPESEDLWKEISRHYGLRYRFEFEWLPARVWLRRYDYGFASVKRAREWHADLIYTRLPQAAAIASLCRVATVYEIHDVPQGVFNPWLLTRFLKGKGGRGLVVITQTLKDALAPWMNRSSLQVIIAPDGVDLVRYQSLPSPEKARKSLPKAFRLSPSDFVAGYSGHLYPGRGAELILDMAANLPEVTFLLVGGDPEDVERLRAESLSRGLDNLILTGFIPNADLPLYQASCDILLMPYQKRVAASSGGDIANYLSPMKVFEYLACGRAILSSDLPVLREVLNDSNSLLLPAEEPATWVAAIRNLRANPHLRQALSAQALKNAQLYSWETRAAKILTLVG